MMLYTCDVLFVCQFSIDQFHEPGTAYLHDVAIIESINWVQRLPAHAYPRLCHGSCAIASRQRPPGLPKKVRSLCLLTSVASQVVDALLTVLANEISFSCEILQLLRMNKLTRPSQVSGRLGRNMILTDECCLLHRDPFHVILSGISDSLAQFRKLLREKCLQRPKADAHNVRVLFGAFVLATSRSRSTKKSVRIHRSS